MDGWYAKYSPSGRFLMRGSEVLSVDGVKVVGDGISGAWFSDNIILYRQHSTGQLRRWAAGLDDEFGPICHQVVASGHGQWAIWYEQGEAPPKTPFVFASDGRTWLGYGGGMNPLAMAPDGTLVMGRHKDGVLCVVAPYSKIPMALAEGRTPRCSARSVVWGYGAGKIGHANLYTLMPRDLTVPGESCHGPVVIDTPDGEWVLTHTDSLRLLLFPVSSPREGFIVKQGVTRDPDAVWTPGGVRVAWSDNHGEPGEEVVDLSKPRVSLIPPKPVPADPSLEVNTWAYFASGGPHWTRDGTHLMQQDATPRTVTFTKFGQSAKREHYYRDDENAIWHHEDHSWTAEQADLWWYRLVLDGPWLRARMRVGDVCAAKGTIFVYNDEQLVREDPFACEVSLSAAWSQYPWGDDVGVAPTICITYDPRPKLSPRRPGNYEKFYFAAGFGWVRWESWRTPEDLTADRMVQSAQFTKQSASAVPPSPPAVQWPHLVTPEPEPEPMPQPVNWYNDADATAFGEWLSGKYSTDLGRDGVDVLGWVRWTLDYAKVREAGMSHAAAIDVVNRRINEIIGLPTPAPNPQ